MEQKQESNEQAKWQFSLRDLKAGHRPGAKEPLWGVDDALFEIDHPEWAAQAKEVFQQLKPNGKISCGDGILIMHNEKIDVEIKIVKYEECPDVLYIQLWPKSPEYYHGDNNKG